MIPNELSQRLANEVQKLPPALVEALNLRFDEAEHKQGPGEPDGFRPTYVDGMALLKRLDQTFDWSLTIKSERFDHTARLAVVVVSVSWKYNGAVGERVGIVETHKDGIGTAPFAVVLDPNTGQVVCVDAGQAMKVAVTDAIRNACKHIGIGRYLWDRPTPGMTPAAQQNVQAIAAAAGDDVSNHPAQPFQVETIVKYFEQTCGYPPEQWMQYVGIAHQGQITVGLANQILREQHPFVQHIVSTTQKRPSGLRASAAR